MVASYIFEPDVANLNYDLISSSRSMVDYDMQEYRVTNKNKYVGEKFIDAFIDMKKAHNSVLVGLSRKIDDSWKLITNPPEEELILENDYLLLMCSGSSKKEHVSTFGVEEGRVIE